MALPATALYLAAAAAVSAGPAAERLGLGGQLRAGAQVLAGHSRSPFLVGPESAPLLNAGILAQAQATVNLVLTPNGELRYRSRRQEYRLAYGPRLFLDMLQPHNAPTVYHILSGKVAVGRPGHLLATLTPSLTIGGLDLGAGGAAPGTLYAGATRPGTIAGIPGNYLSFNLQGRLEGPAGRYKLASTQLYQVARSPASLAEPDTVYTLPVGGHLLYNLTRFDSLNELTLPAQGGAWRLQLTPGWTNFPATQTYLTLAPAVAWQRPFGLSGQLSARLGAFAFLTGHLPGNVDYAQAFALVEAGVAHGLAALGLKRLKGGLGVALAPYYDPLYGNIQPRTTITGNLAYDFTRILSASLQVRYYTGRYFNWQVLPGRDLDVVISTLTFRAAISRHLSAQIGGYAVNRKRVPSRTSTFSASNDYFGFVGLDGTLPL